MALPRFLYHGTSREHVFSILNHGLVPGGRDGAIRADPSRPDAVYLGLGNTLFYASMKLPRFRTFHPGAVIEVNTAPLNPFLLRPYQNEVIDHLSDIDGEIYHQNLSDERRRATLERRYSSGEWSYKTHPKICLQSLRVSSQLLYFGVVPPSAIRRVIFVTGHRVHGDNDQRLYTLQTPIGQLLPIGSDSCSSGTDLYLQRLFAQKSVTPQRAKEILQADKAPLLK